MKFVIIPFCSLIATVPLRAEHPVEHVSQANSPAVGRISLDEVTRTVLANNPAIKSAIKRWNAAKARVPQAAAWDDLKVSADSRLARFVSVPANAFTDQMLTVEQMIPIAGKNRSRARIAAAEALAALEEMRRQQLDFISKAREAYYQLENAYAQLELNRKSTLSLKQIAEISRSQYEVGTRTAADVLVAESEASKLQETERDLLRTLSDAQSQLNVLMNRDAFAPLGEPVQTSANAPNLPLSQLRRLMLTNRPEVRMAQAKVEAEKARLQLAHRDWIPDVSVNVRAQRYNQAGQAVSELGAGISVTVPWLNRSKYSAETLEASEGLSAAEQDLERIRTEASGLLREQLQKIETAHHHVELFRDKLLPEGRQAFEATQLGYETGKTGFLEWITAQRNLRDLESMARQHLADFQIAIVQLNAVIGTEFQPPRSSKSDLHSK